MIVWLLLVCGLVKVVNAEEPLNPDWVLFYAEDFSTPLDDASTPWFLEDYSEPFDTIMDDAGLWYQNDYGPAMNDALNSFSTYRKEFPVGQDGWLTASLSARDWDKDGNIEDPPTLVSKNMPDGSYVAELKVPDHTGGVIFRNSRPLPAEYRIEYKLKTIDFGGKRYGEIEYDNRNNGYSTNRCKTQHPWGEAWRRGGWSGNASDPYCEWPDVIGGEYGYNGFYYLAITDFADPAPRNNHFWHIRRKVQIEGFYQHPDRIGDSSGGQICNSDTNEYYDYADSSFNTVNMWMCSLPGFEKGWGQLTSCSSWFMTSCSDGVAQQGLFSAAELQPELMPDEYYTFAIERNSSGYTLETSGNFARVGYKKLRFHRQFIEGEVPIWHYNTEASEYDGRFNADLVQNADFGSTTWSNMWPAGSAYPDYFVIGDVYSNVYEGSASLTDIRLYGLAKDAPVKNDPPTAEPVKNDPPTAEPVKNDPPTAEPVKNDPPTAEPKTTGIAACDPTRDCDTDSDCATGLFCAEKHRPELKAQKLNERLADCEIDTGDIVNRKWEVCFDPAVLSNDNPPTDATAKTDITECDPNRDCDYDSECADGLLCADRHKPELLALNLDKRLANCDFAESDIVNHKWEVCFDATVLPRRHTRARQT